MMDDSRFVIIGSKGQLGTALREKYPNARAVDADELDITNSEAVNNFDWENVTTILNAAAYTNVDGAETNDGRVAAWRVNAIGPRNLSKIASQKDITLVHISTEYVFDGMAIEPHKEDETPSPLSAYGSAKAAGDLAVSLSPKHYICRTTWLIGEGKNFVRTMLGLGKKGVAPTVVADQIGHLTFTSELVRAIDHLLKTSPAYGTYNVTNSGDPASWADVTRAIFQLGNFNLAVTGTTTAEYYAGKPEAAARPLNGVMNLEKLQQAGFSPNDWHDDLKAYIGKELAGSR
ncbi:MAG: SDR family oxidoreductase [Candidatus Saccharimonadales bacterium]